MVDCLNLRDLYGATYHIRREDPAATFADPWHHIIPCRHGHIYPHGGQLLAFASRRCGGVARRVAALPFAVVLQSGDDGMNIAFPAERFAEVAEIVRPRRRKVMSAEHRAAAIESLRRFRQGAALKASSGDLERVQPSAPSFESSGVGERSAPL